MVKLKKHGRLWLLSAPVLLGLSGCASSPIVTDSFCSVAAEIPFPLTYSSSGDTLLTREGIDRANGAWLCQCRKECPEENSDAEEEAEEEGEG